MRPGILALSVLASALLPVHAVWAQTPSPSVPADSTTILRDRNSVPPEIDKTDQVAPENAKRDKTTQSTAKSPDDTINDADRNFVMAASKAGATEIEAGRLAIGNSGNEKLKKFADRMIDDHGKLVDKLNATLQKQNMDIPRADPDDDTMALLKSLRGDDFDQAYIQHVAIDGHRKAIDILTAETEKGSNPELKSLAKSALPAIKHHLEMAKKLDKASKPVAKPISDGS